MSGFYKEKEGVYQEKKAKVKIVSYPNNATEGQKVCSVPFNLSKYIGKGLVKESLQLTGNAFFVDFEIMVEYDSTSVRASMALSKSNQSMAGCQSEAVNCHASVKIPSDRP